MKRSGILAGGNFIIDHVKIIDTWPQQEMLANIVSETSSNGGGPYNVLKDLAAMKAPFPLAAVGLVGQDASGNWVIRDCNDAGIDSSRLKQTASAPTSYTDAMTVASTGRRTFFHQRGANALLGEEHFDFTDCTHKIFHLGYLMLLDEMDRLLPGGRTVASVVLERAQRAGLVTTVDIVSADHPDFQEITEESLPFTDCLVINEIEAGKIVGATLRTPTGVDLEAAKSAAMALIKLGVRRQVVIHFVEGAVAADSTGEVTVQGSLELPSTNFIVGATGAGDAFAAGYLYGLHEDWDITESMRLGMISAAACLTDATPSKGLRSLDECRALVSEMRFRNLA